MSDALNDKKAADIFLPAIMGILRQRGAKEIRLAAQDEDFYEATDLIVDGKRWGIRMRPVSYCYDGQITIRYSRPSGKPTEWHKILSGYGDYNFYGFGDYGTGKIDGYTLLDLNKFRQCCELSEIRSEVKFNVDNSSAFKVFWLESFPSGVVLDYVSLPEILATPEEIERSKNLIEKLKQRAEFVRNRNQHA